MKSKSLNGLTGVSNKILGDLDRIDQLKKIANRSNYQHKVKRLHERVTQEYSFWAKKGKDAPQLKDLFADLQYLNNHLQETQFALEDKATIDGLLQKYPID